MRSTGVALGVAVSSAACAVATPPVYLGLLSLASLRGHACGLASTTRFVIVVPAYNEEHAIGATLASLATLDYPAALVKVIVVADNCKDETAVRAFEHGATVFERDDPGNPGKGQALAWAFDRILDREDFDAIVVVDADTVVDPHLLLRAAHHLDGGVDALQVDYRVRNPGASWRTRLLDVAFTCHHRLRGRGRSALGLSVGLRGNGMVFSRNVLTSVPYQAFSVVEDVEYGIMLGRRGVVVAGCDSTFVAGDMPTDAASSGSQRIRWELGRHTLRRTHGAALVRDAVRSRSPVLADLAADLWVPPLTTIVAGLCASTVLTVGSRTRKKSFALWAVGIGWAGLVGHVAAGTAASQGPLQAIGAMIRLPAYMIWKVSVRISRPWRDQRVAGTRWTRTERSADVGDRRTREAVSA